MKTKHTTRTIWIAMALFIFISCGKDGAIGPEGPIGSQGEHGEQGIAGEDGSMFYSGSGTPNATLGKNGDMYLDRSASRLYGPKNNEGWGVGLNLRGSTGTAGSKILSGTAVPAANLGSNGDFYLNRNNGNLYGPKINNSWGNPISLKGPKGDTGNANVLSKTFLPANITWRQTILFGTNYVTASLNMTEITQDVINGGSVQVYGGFFWGDTWSALPISYFESGRTVHFSYSIRQGSVTLREHYSTNTNPTAPGIQFRVVVIPPRAAATAKRSQIDLTKYDEVKQFFQLKN